MKISGRRMEVRERTKGTGCWLLTRSTLKRRREVLRVSPASHRFPGESVSILFPSGVVVSYCSPDISNVCNGHSHSSTPQILLVTNTSQNIQRHTNFSRPEIHPHSPLTPNLAHLHGSTCTVEKSTVWDGIPSALDHSVSGMSQMATGISIQQRSSLKIIMSIGDGIPPNHPKDTRFSFNAFRDADPFFLCKDFSQTPTLTWGSRQLVRR